MKKLLLILAIVGGIFYVTLDQTSSVTKQAHLNTIERMDKVGA